MLTTMVRLAVIAVPLIHCGPAAAQDGSPPAHSPNASDRGRQLFAAVGCAQCHGTVGQGGVGPRLAPDPLPADAIAQYIRAPAGVMPPYVEKVLGDSDVQDIQAYLAGIPQPPALRDIPLLSR